MREEVREFKRKRILETAERLFYERGYEATTVDLIASELNVRKPFIYSYFANKAAILEAVYGNVAERLLSYMSDEPDDQTAPDVQLRALVQKFVIENIRNQEASGVYLQEEKHLSPEAFARIRTAEREFNHRLTSLIEDGAARGVFNDVNARLASLSISGMVRWVHRWYRADGALGPDSIADQIADYALRIVGYDSGKLPDDVATDPPSPD